MKRSMLFVGAVVALLTAVGQTATTTRDLPTLAAGRIRFAEGNGARMTLTSTTVIPGIDMLVPVGATIQTGSSRLEVATLNGDLFWFGHDTIFDFEGSDPGGEATTLFLGKGSVVVQAAAPFTLVTGAGTLLIHGGGTYVLSKEREGKRRTTVATIAGPQPTVLKHATIFNRFSFETQAEGPLLAWSRQREEDWRITLWRADLFSHVEALPPMVAYTTSGGQRQWRRVTHAGPLTFLNPWLRGGLWTGGYDTGRLHTLGVLPAGLVGKSTFETAAWFRSNRYNSLRWAWSVELGWHAEWYWNPLAGTDAEFGAGGLLYLDAWFGGPGPFAGPLPFRDGLVSPWDWFDGPRRSGSAQAAVPPRGRPVLSAPIPSQAGKYHRVLLAENARLQQRLRTDPGLRTLRQARSLAPSWSSTMSRRGTAGPASRTRSSNSRASRRQSGSSRPAGMAPAAATPQWDWRSAPRKR